MRKGNNRVRSLDCFLGGSQERASLRTGYRQAADLTAKAEPFSQLSGGEMGVADSALSRKTNHVEEVCWICVITSKLVTNCD